MEQTTTAIAQAKTLLREPSALCKNFEQKVLGLRKNYQSFEKFALDINPDSQVDFGADIRETIMNDYSTLEMLDMAFGEGSASAWLVTSLADLNKFSGSKNMDDGQTKWLAKLIFQEYKHVKYSVMQLFFYRFKVGDFGKFYGKVDPMVITCALKDFVAECEAKKQEYLNEEYAEHKKEEQQWQELQNRAKGYWYCCLKSLVDDCPDDDGKELFSRVSFFVFYEDKRTLLLSASDSDYGMIENCYFDFFKQAIIKSFPNIRVQCIINNKED